MSFDPDVAGINCQTDVNDCLSHPCLHGAFCIDQVNSYYCNCTNDYTGVTCEIDINTCRSSPCHNGTCVNQENSFQCHCEAGYTGQRCEQIIDNCLLQPCLNGGSCSNDVNSFCESLDCSAVCLNSGNCEISYISDLHQNFNISCVCKRGYSGKNCETVDADVCLNGGSVRIVTMDDSKFNVTCKCQQGFQGFYCEEMAYNASMAINSNIVVYLLRNFYLFIDLVVDINK